MYFGEFTKSIGWAHKVHRTLTHALTFTERLETAMKQIQIPEHKEKEYQNRLREFDPRKQRHFSKFEHPIFHLTKEERKFTKEGKKVAAEVLSIHNSVSAAPLIQHMMGELSCRRLLTFIQSKHSKKFRR